MPDGNRRLAAIMFTDMVGYTALGQRNESLSLALVEEQRKLVSPIVTRHKGREVKTIGDSILMEFASALDATRCAYDIQRAIRELNFSLPSDRRIHLRIGLHLGDVVESQRDISGDAVNVASRIEPLAEDGGVCLTREIYNQVNNKFDLPLRSLGTKVLKNVNAPVEIYKMEMPWRVETPVTTRKLDKRRIAILPLTNMSPDPNDSFFADGVTEEIISIASTVSGLSVISRTSVMGYKGTTKKVKEIGQELNVGSVLEGSFRKAGNRIRITTQLINVNDDSHLWAQSYDRELDDIFAVQTDVAKQVADALKVRILPNERRRIEKTPTRNTAAYSLYLKGRHYWNTRTEESMKTAIKYFEKAIEKDPEFALALVGIADCYGVLLGHGYIRQSDGFPRVRDYIARALKIDEELGEAHASLGGALHFNRDWAQSEKEFTRALELSPSYATGHQWYSQMLTSKGMMSEALAEIERAHQLDPNSPQILVAKGIWLYYAREYDRAIEQYRKVLNLDPDFLPALGNLFLALRAQSKLEEAASLIPRYIKMVGKSVAILAGLAHLYAAVGDTVEARKALEEAERVSDGEYTSPFDIGMAHYHLGEADVAFEWFYKAMRVKDPSLLWLKVEPEFDPLRSDPRFADLLKQVGLD